MHPLNRELSQTPRTKHLGIISVEILGSKIHFSGKILKCALAMPIKAFVEKTDYTYQLSKRLLGCNGGWGQKHSVALTEVPCVSRKEWDRNLINK